jgi:2-dehydropantoate 2-reductase
MAAWKAGAMRYIIIGAGAVGGTIGARLFESGHEVVLVARGAHYAALRDGGLRFATPADVVTLPVPVVAGPDEVSLHADDVLILTVKTQDSVAALDTWAWQPVTGGGAAADSLPVFCASNGVASERIALRRFRRVYGVCVWLPATHLQPGSVEAQGMPMSGMLPVGRYPAGVDDTARQVAAELAGSKFLAPVSETVMRYKHGKLLSNLANAVEAVCGPAATRDGNATGVADLVGRARDEGVAVLDAAGIDYIPRDELIGLQGEQVRIEPVSGAQRSGGSSWQSLSRGTGSIEADFLNGEIALLGREHGIPVPVNEMLQRLANEFARDRRAPGSITGDEMAALLRAGAITGTSGGGDA